ncbi:MAG: hypothetical protein ACTSWP_08150 [Candidatus Freyarchaeota archaeon]
MQLPVFSVCRVKSPSTRFRNTRENFGSSMMVCADRHPTAGRG